MNALFDKILSRLRMKYENLLKFSKILKKIKTFFIRIDNRPKKYKKLKKKFRNQVNQLVFKKFVSIFSRPIYTFQYFVLF